MHRLRLPVDPQLLAAQPMGQAGEGGTGAAAAGRMMRPMTRLSLAVLLWFACAAQAQVCPDPAKPCAGFKENDLSFVLPKDGVARDEVRSPPFWAVILRTADPCTIQDKERAAAQALFPRNKVFHTRFECDGDVENNVTYTNVNAKFGFLAVY